MFLVETVYEFREVSAYNNFHPRWNNSWKGLQSCRTLHEGNESIKFKQPQAVLIAK